MARLTVPGVFRAHLAVIAAFVAAHVATKAVSLATGRDHLLGLAPLFNLAREDGPANFFSAAALLVAAGVAWLLWRAEPDRRTARGWGVAALVLAFLAFDEGAGLHDRLAVLLQARFETTGVFYIAWVVPYAALVLLVGAVCLPLLRALPRATLTRLVAAGALYVGSAMGMELFQSALLSEAAQGARLGEFDRTELNRDPLVVASVTAEEAGEMLAVALALRALLLHLVGHLGVRSVALSLGRAGTSPTVPFAPPPSAAAAAVGRREDAHYEVAAE